MLHFPEFDLACSVPGDSDSVSPSHRVIGSRVSLGVGTAFAEYYRHGWQSWSLTCWHGIDAPVPVQHPRILQPMQTDAIYAHRTDPSGAWVGAVRDETGRTVLLGALGTDARVEYADGALIGYSDAGDEKLMWLVAAGEESDVFSAYARALGDRFGTAPSRDAPRVWCSWYSLYTGITESAISRVIEDIHLLPVDVVQIDDGWQVAVGDWRANEEFPSGMASIAAAVRAQDKRAGLWLAPLIVCEGSAIAREHRDWLIRGASGAPVSAGFNWGRQLYGLDTTHPDARAWLSAFIREVRGWGYDYLKLDFLYGAALSGLRHNPMPREAAYRDALAVIREAAGAAYLVTCGAPIIPSVGLCDAIRIGPDVSGFWSSGRDEFLLANPTIPGTRNAVRTTVHRLWLKEVVGVDPDVFYVSPRGHRLAPWHREMLFALARLCDFRATSDLPHWFADGSSAAADLARAFAPALATHERRYSYRFGASTVDFSEAMTMPGPRSRTERTLANIVSSLASMPIVMRVMHVLAKRDARRRVREMG